MHDGDGHAALTGAVTATVGFSSSFAIVLAGLRAVGASESQAASGLLALCIATGALGIALSMRYRMPISAAWSTPGAALLVTAGRGHFGFPSAVGAFVVAGALAVAAGALPLLRRLVSSIPPAVGSAMLAGILLPICVTPVEAVVRLPRLALPVVVTWLIVDRIVPRVAVPAAVIATAIVIAVTEPVAASLGRSALPSLHWTSPSFHLAALVGIAVPLFVVTMAAQNVPGMAVLKAFGYDADIRPLVVATGGASVVTAPFGGHAVNLAAITAALVAAPEAHADRDRRWLASTAAGACYVVFGLGAGVAAVLATASPPLLLETVAGLALLRALAGALAAVGGATTGRDAAVLAFVVTASGVAPGGVGSAFWGLLAGAVLTIVATHGPTTRRNQVPIPRATAASPSRRPIVRDEASAARQVPEVPEGGH